MKNVDKGRVNQKKKKSDQEFKDKHLPMQEEELVLREDENVDKDRALQVDRKKYQMISSILSVEEARSSIKSKKVCLQGPERSEEEWEHFPSGGASPISMCT